MRQTLVRMRSAGPAQPARDPMMKQSGLLQSPMEEKKGNRPGKVPAVSGVF